MKRLLSLLTLSFLLNGCAIEKIEKTDPVQCLIPIRIVVLPDCPTKYKFSRDALGNYYLVISEKADYVD